VSYLEDAAAELAKIRQANDELRARAGTAREDRQASADAADAVVAETSFRLAAAYTALAALERDTAPPAGAAPRDPADADEFAAAERAAGHLPARRKE